MWLSERRRFLVSIAGLLAGACGFSPALEPGGALRLLDRSVVVAEPRNTNEFLLSGAFQSRFGPPDTPKYRMQYQLRLSFSGAGITPDNETTRGEITGVLTYTLLDLPTGLELRTETVRTLTGYGRSGTTAASEFAREDAIERTIEILADLAISDLIASRVEWAS
ncbi:MAG: hypothetical protein AAFX00_03045 [Pseudomonadota bacterium]